MRALFVALSALLMATASAQPSPDRAYAASPGPEPVVIDPGRVAALTFQVANPRPTPVETALAWAVPPGWSVLTAPDSIRLAPSDQSVVLLSVRAPLDAASGEHTVELRVGEEVVQRSVRIRARAGVRVEAVAVPRRLVAGNVEHAVWHVENVGNDTSGVRLALHVRGLRAAGVPERMVLAPGEGREVSVGLEAPGPLRAAETGWLWLQAWPDGHEDAAARARASVLVIPAPTARRGRAPQATLVGRASTLRSALGVGAQAGIEADVPLRGDGLVRAYLIAETPTSIPSRYQTQNDLAAGITAPGLSARLGTGTYALSPLAGSLRYGVGGEVAVERGSIKLTGVVRQPTEGTVELGGRVGAEVRGVEVEGNVFRRGGDVPASALSVRASTRAERGRLDAEAGAAGTGRWAARLSGSGRWRSVVTTAELRHIERGHPASPSGERAATATATRPLGASVQLRVHVSDRTRGGADSLSPQVPSGLPWARRQAAASLRHRAGGPRGRVSSRVGLRAESAARGAYRAGALLAVLSGTAQRGPWTGSLGIEGGRVTDLAEGGGSSPALDANASLAWQRGGSNLLVGVRGGRGTRVEGAGGVPNWAARLQGTVRHRGAQVRATARWSGTTARPGGAPWGGYGVLDLRLTGRLPLRDGVFLVGDLADVRVRGARRPLDVRLGVEVQLRGRGPLRLRSDGVVGRVVDAVSGAGLPDVFVHLGDDVALTDAGGRFEFDRPGPGVHSLQIDPLSLHRGAVPLIPLPLDVDVPPEGEVPEIVVPVALSANVAGHIRAYEIRGGLGTVAVDTVRVESPARARVVARRNGEARAVLTDRRGAFRFENLAPGRWRLETAGGEAVVDVTPGGRAEVELRVVRPAHRLRLVPAPREIVGLRSPRAHAAAQPRRQPFRTQPQGRARASAESSTDLSVLSKPEPTVPPHPVADAFAETGATDARFGAPGPVEPEAWKGPFGLEVLPVEQRPGSGAPSAKAIRPPSPPKASPATEVRVRHTGGATSQQEWPASLLLVSLLLAVTSAVAVAALHGCRRAR